MVAVKSTVISPPWSRILGSLRTSTFIRAFLWDGLFDLVAVDHVLPCSCAIPSGTVIDAYLDAVVEV